MVFNQIMQHGNPDTEIVTTEITTDIRKGKQDSHLNEHRHIDTVQVNDKILKCVQGYNSLTPT